MQGRAQATCLAQGRLASVWVGWNAHQTSSSSWVYKGCSAMPPGSTPLVFSFLEALSKDDAQVKRI